MANLIGSYGDPAWNAIPLGTLGLLAPRQARGMGFFDHFEASHVVGSSAGANLVAGWNVVFSSGNGTIVDAALADGAVTLTPHTDDNDEGYMRRFAAFTPIAGRMISFGTQLKVSDADKVTYWFGLTASATTPSQTPQNSRVGFYANGAVSILAVNDKAGTNESNDTTADLADDTMVELSFVIDELKSITYYVNGVEKVKTTTVADIPNVVMAPTLCISNAGGTPTLTPDYCWCYAWAK